MPSTDMSGMHRSVDRYCTFIYMYHVVKIKFNSLSRNACSFVVLQITDYFLVLNENNYTISTRYGL